MQKKFFPLLIISSLLIMGVFGFLGLGSVDHNAQHNCPIPLMSGGDCPPVGNTMALASHHVSGLQYFTQSIISIDSSLLMLSTLLVFALLFFSKFSQETSLRQPLSHEAYQRIAESRFIPKKQFLRWLALRHKRDPRALRWVYDMT